MDKMIQLDMSELNDFVTSAGAKSKEFRQQVKPVIAKAGLQLRRKMRADASKSKHFKRIKPRITYDITDRGMAVHVGPKLGWQGSLAHIAYYGGVRGGGGKIADPVPYLAQEAETARSFIGKLAQEMIANA